MGTDEMYRVLVLGDFHYGESYTRAGARILAEHGYEHSTVHLRPFVEACDTTVVNLETPLVDPELHPSPFAGKKTYVHWADPDASGNALRALGVDAVSLANNHTLDHGAAGLESTFQTLTDLGIEWFGAGRTLKEARVPHRLHLPDRIGGGEIDFHGAFQYSARNDERFDSYAGEDSPGCAPLSVPDVPDAREGERRADTFHIAFPHWGRNYAWRSQGQYRLAHRLLRKDYDLVLGHGGHTMQEVHRKQQRWVVYGLGNGNFQSGGRWQQYEEQNGIIPFSFWAVLEVQVRDGRRSLTLKLYPVYSDNSVTNYQAGPVTEVDFSRVVETLRTRPARPWRFDNPAQSTGRDDLGFHLSLELGEWLPGERPSRLPAVIETGDPGDWPLRSPDRDIEDQIIGLSKGLSSSMIAVHAERDGATARWLNNRVVLIESSGKRFLAYNYTLQESSVGGSVVGDKVLAADIMSASGVKTPKTIVVHAAAEAGAASREFSGPVVVKPRSGNKSRGVSAGLLGEDEVREAFVAASEYDDEVLVQEHIEVAEELRIMASPHQAVAVNRRIFPHVVGDGMSSISQLVEDKNLQRALNPSLTNRPIPADAPTLRHLERQGRSLASVPGMGERVTVRGFGGLSAGADTHQALDTIDQRLKEAAVAAVAAIPGLGWGGVDMIVQKDTGEPYVIEVNTRAGYGSSLFPTYGQPRDVSAVAWRLRVEATAPETYAPPKHAAPLDETRPLSLDPGSVKPGGTVTFSRLFEASLVDQVYQIDRKSNRVWLVAPPHGDSIWVTNRGMTVTDRAVVASVMRHHQWVRALLEIAEVPCTRYREVTSTRTLERFIRGRVGSVVLAPVRAAWDGAEARVLSAEEALSLTAMPERMWVQARPTGRRVRVFASRNRSWVMTSKPGSSKLGRASIKAAGELAVQAVRAVPELRWAVVDVLVRARRIREGRPNGALVEGLTQRPEFGTDDRIIAGDFDAFTRWIVDDPSRQPNETSKRGEDQNRGTDSD